MTEIGAGGNSYQNIFFQGKKETDKMTFFVDTKTQTKNVSFKLTLHNPDII